MKSTAPLLALLCASCFSFVEDTERDPGLETPEQFGNLAEDAATAPPNERFWEEFGSEELNQLVEQALANNRQLLAAVARRDAAAANAVIAGADLLPSVAASLDAARQRQVFVGLPIPGAGPVTSQTFTNYQASLSISWELDIWGRIRAGDLAANADLEATQADLTALRLSIAGRTIQSFFRVIEAKERLELVQAQAATLRQTESLVDRRFRTGVRPAFDLRSTRTDRETAEAQIHAAARALDNARRELQVLLGEYPDADVVEAETLPPIPPGLPSILPGELLTRRPDLVAAERRLAAADARGGQARAARLPALTLGATGGTASEDFEDLFDPDFKFWSLTGGLLAPIFQGGRLEAQVDARDAERSAAWADWSQAALTAYSEVEIAYASSETLLLELERRDTAAVESLAASELADQRYARGLVDIVTVLDSRRRSLQAQVDALAARTATLNNRVDLLLALGGGLPAEDQDTELARSEETQR